MPRAKAGQQKPKEPPPTVLPLLQKFLRTYEKCCAQTQTSPCPALQRDLRSSISNEQVLRKLTLVRAEDTAPRPRPVSLEPLLMAMAEATYTQGTELCLWRLRLSNPEIARLASYLESKGPAGCPLTTLVFMDCQMSLWSLGRLGNTLQLSALHWLTLDYCKLGGEGLGLVLAGLETNQRLRGLSLRHCGLGPPSGEPLAAVILLSAICELRLDGNYLQCSGAQALLGPLAQCTEGQARDASAAPAPDPGTPSQVLPATHQGRSSLNRATKPSGAIRARMVPEKTKRKKGIRKKSKGLAEAGPWLVKLSLADNGIDGRGEGGEGCLLGFIRLLSCLIQSSAHLREIDLGSNVLGEKAAAGILEALRARKTGKLPALKIIVTPQISSETFRSIWKSSQKSRVSQKKKKKAKN
ncbi:uncharacterized protein LOC129402199 [Sorex araneus]|uniref:uncharacterized protein LOC129402199 n=1 Tax=Sorex araneus TaxID=42254 RepID=UPI002433B003|nr:uncharacterized protein LOC129402199 [Sorex araneus]